MEFQFDRHRIDKIPRSEIISELGKAAEHFQYTEFTKREFNEISSISASTVQREFGSWSRAIAAIRENLAKKDIDLEPRRKGSYSDMQLFKEMERIWGALGHRPSKIEWQSSEPNISYIPYSRYFGGCEKAGLRFIEYKMGGEVTFAEEEQEQNRLISPDIVDTTKKTRRKRNVPLRLRLDILKRDNFRCVFCGRSPATEVGVVLHLDHITPFSKGGDTVFDNLQTLCERCNLGKSDRDVV